MLLKSRLLISIFVSILFVEECKATLKSVQLIFRHGQRTGDASWGNRTGMLTDIGKEEMYELGKLVRERYSDFLDAEYNPNEIRIISSASLRCIQSGLLFAYGLYETYNLNANWSRTDIPYDPIPVESIPEEFDKYLQLTNNCPRRETLKTEMVLNMTDRLVAEDPDIRHFLEVCAKETNNSVPLDESCTTLERVFPCALYIEPAQKNPNPTGWATPFREMGLFERMLSAYNQLIDASLELKQMERGPFLEMLHLRMNQSSDFRKMYAYVSHDFSLHAIRGLFEQEMKEFSSDLPTGSAFFLEVHESDSEPPFLQIYFRNGTTSTLKKIENIPGCSPTCLVTGFGEIIQPYVPENYDNLCNGLTVGVPAVSATSGSKILIGTIIAFCLTLLVIALVQFNRVRRQYSQIK